MGNNTNIQTPRFKTHKARNDDESEEGEFVLLAYSGEQLQH